MMNWLFGKPKNNLPEPTALQAHKAKQIEQLKVFNQGVSEIHRDVEYRVNTIVKGTTIALYITLPPQFPHDKPSVKVSPPIKHPWVNEQMLVIGCQGINQFVVHSDLGKEIRSIVEEFQRNPPTFLPPQQQYAPVLPYPLTAAGIGAAKPPTLQGYTPYTQQVASFPATAAMPTLPPIVSTAASTVTTPYSPAELNTQSTTRDLNGYAIANMPVNFPQLEQLSVSELQQLAVGEDEEKVLEILMNLPQVQKIKQDRQELAESNEALARSNLEMKPKIEEKKKILLEKYDAMNELKHSFDKFSKQQDLVHDRFDLGNLQTNLKIEAMKVEEEAEEIAENFVNGQITVEEFNKKYMQKRKLCHLRKVKEEKLANYIAQNQVGF